MPQPPARRVVVTGVGLISPLGNSPAELWSALSSGRSGVEQLASLPTENLSISCGGEARQFRGKIDDFGPLAAPQKKQIRKGLKVMCREIQMGVAAAQRALANAGLALGDYDSDRMGVVYGSDYIMTLPDEFTDGIKSCMEADTFHFEKWATCGLSQVTPLWLLKYLPNMPASHIAIYNDLRGPNNSLTLREASANLAISEAYTTIGRGSADRIIAGATGTRIHPLRTVHVALQEELATDGEAHRLSRPFDQQRQGSVLGEGAGALVLEELSAAEQRGAEIWGEVVGYGSSTVLESSGLAHRGKAIENALQLAIRSAKLEVSEVGHVHAHGLGTRQSDIEEAGAFERVFAGCRPPVLAAKSYFGNLGAGSGAVETIASLLAMKNDALFPILNYETPDPECPISASTAGAPAGDAFVNVNVSPQAQASAIVIRRFPAIT